MRVIVTGTAGFIGYFVANNLLGKGHYVVGIDNVNSYYDTRLKEARLQNLKKFENFKEARIDMKDRRPIEAVFEDEKPDIVINLAAQAGVRYSFENPHAYLDSNVYGFLNILEGCRHCNVKHLVFASTASVYGANGKMPWSEHDGCSHQLSLYAATKKANESMGHSYSHLFNIPSTCLRFFNVYGPWGRPDMALFLFAKNIIAEKPIDVFNNGHMVRDFTYVEDIAEGVCRVALGPIPEADKNWDGSVANPDPSSSGVAPFKMYNIGNSNPVKLMRYIELIEREVGKKAVINFMPIQPGEIEKSEADNAMLYADYDFKPKVSVEEGVHNFVKWYREFYGV